MSAENIQQWLEDRLDVAVANGPELRLRECLFCGRARTMKVNVELRKFICHHDDCGRSGSIVSLIQAVEGCERDEARRILSTLIKGIARGHKSLKELAEQLRAVKAAEPEEPSPEQEPVHDLPEDFIPCWDGHRWRVPAYLKTRGVSRESIRRWGIGYCVDGECAGRVVVPIRSDGRTGWQARKINPEDFGPKYVTPDNAASNFLLFGYDELEPDGEYVAVEGIFDAIRLWSYGYQAVAYLKDRISVGQADLLSRLNPRRVLLMPDGGDRRAMSRALKDGHLLQARFPVAVCRLPDGLDPDTCEVSAIRESIESAEVVGATASTEFIRSTMKNPWRKR